MATKMLTEVQSHGGSAMLSNRCATFFYYFVARGLLIIFSSDLHVLQAPGTFGFDHSKYRPPRGDGMSIPMDEFGQQNNKDDRSTDGHQRVDGSDEFHEMRLHANTSAHDETQLPARQGHSPSPAPFSDYPASTVEVRRAMQNRPEPNISEAQAKASSHQRRSDKVDDEEGGSGCCKCVVM
jgi:hypothetical protein